ncbi:MAG TPA: TolC family protein [Bryobacteraceae bacterium]|nr:TolC family protein [Bryobacteraceae bacterium]
MATVFSAFAQEQRLSLRDLIPEALKSNPEIAAAQKRFEASRQRPTQESSLPDPMLGVGYSSAGSPLPGRGIGVEPNANAGMMISQEVPFPGKLKLRGQMAERESEAEFQRFQSVQLNVLQRLKSAYFQLHRDYANTDVLRRNLDLLRKFLRITEARYSVGKAAQQDIFKAQTQISILETRLVQLDQDRRSREAELNSLLNRQPNSPVARPEDLTAKPLLDGLEELYAKAEQNSPMLRSDEKMIQSAELASNLARKEYYPDFGFTGGYYNMGSMPDMYEFRVDVKLPLYFWRKQRAGVAERSSLLSAARRTREATGQTLRFRLKDDYLMADASYRLLNLYATAVIPQATLALESSLTSYQTGTVDFLSVLMNFMTAVEYEMNYYDEMMTFQQAVTRLEEMTGSQLLN